MLPTATGVTIISSPTDTYKREEDGLLLGTMASSSHVVVGENHIASRKKSTPTNEDYMYKHPYDAGNPNGADRVAQV